MSSSRRRSSPSHGDAGSSVATAAASSSLSGTTGRRSRRNGSSSSSSSSKKRRYEDIVNRCRNPFCGAELENKHQRYCEASRLCQLHRGMMLDCAWPNAPREEGVAAEAETSATTARGSSNDTPSTAATASRRGSASTTASADANGDVAMVGGDKRTRAAAPGESSGTKRLKLGGSTMSSASTTAAPSVSSTTTATTTATTAAQQVKAAAIEVVPLGVGSRGGGGGRYVQSGNRTVGAPSLPPPSVSTASAASDAPTTRAPSPLQPSPRALLPTPGSSLGPAPPSRSLSRANSLPVTTTNKSRDPRVRFNPSAAAAAAATGSGGDGDAAGETNGGLKRISPADYLNNMRHRAAGNEAPAAGSSMTSASETLLSSRPPDHQRTLERTTSSSSVTNADAGSSSFRSSLSGSSAYADPSRQLRRASSDTTTSFAPYEPVKTDRYPSQNQPHGVGAYHGSSLPTAGAGDRGHADHHNDRSQYQQDRPPLSRTSSSASVTSSSHPRADVAAAAASLHGTPSDPRTSRAERLFGSVLRPMFSHSDPFLRLVITRMASFLPGALSPIRNKTTKPRKLQFYLEYAERVHKYCGRLVKLDVKDGVASLTIAGREWLSITGSSTSDLYQEILERILTDSERWRDLILEFQRMRSEDQRRLGSNLIPGVTFLKVWSSMKKRKAEKASDFDFQSGFIAGKEHYHWTFVAGNVEIGSGTSKEKLRAFRAASSSAADFVKDLMILPDSEKHNVAKEDSAAVSDRSSPRTTRSGPVDRPSVTREGTESSSRRSSASDTPTTTSAPAAPGRGAIDTPAAAAAAAPVPTPVSATAAAVERIVEEPSAAAAVGNDTEPQRTRSDSWTDTTDPNQATFSPVVRSESDHEDDSDQMSISDDDDDATPAKRAAPNAVASTSAAATSGGTHVAAVSGVSVPVAAPQQHTAPVPVPASASGSAPPQSVASAAPPHQVSVPAPAPAPPPAPVPSPVPAPTAAPARPTPAVAVTIPGTPSAVPAPLVSPSCRFCAGIQKSNPTGKCLKCQKSQPKAASAAAASLGKTSSAKQAIDSLHLFLHQNVVQPVKSAAKALMSASSDSVTSANASSSTSSANVIESLPSSTASTPRNNAKQ